MRVTLMFKKTTLKIAALVAATAIITGCSGMMPFDLHNNREEGPEKGLFSGSSGEFVIYQGELPASQQTQKNGEKPKNTE